MNENPPHVESASLLASMLDSDDSAWARMRFEDDIFPDYGRLLGEIVMLLGDQEIEYLSSRVKVSEDGIDVVVAIFTRDLLIVSEKSHATASTTTAKSRASLTEIQGHGTMAVYSNDFGSTWPGRYQVALTYGNASPLGLPLGIQGSERSRKLSDFLPSLLADLSR